MHHFIAYGLRWLILGTAWVAVCSASIAAEGRVDLREDAADPRAFAVSSHLQVDGNMQAAAGGGKAVNLKLKVNAQLGYAERRLSGTGRDAQAFRSLRQYDKVTAEISVGDQLSYPRLRDGVRLMVAHGQREGVQLFSPSGPLTYEELELLRAPGDSLALLALLPGEPVEKGDEWKPADWVLQLLSGLEAVEKSALTCKLDSITGDMARVGLKGEISGATLGAAANIKVDGHFLFDTRQKHLSHFELTQTEKRSVGAVSPGLEVTAKLIVDRQFAPVGNKLTGLDISKLPLDPNDANQLLTFEGPEWNVRFYYDRRWHVFHQTSRVAVLRFVDKGNLIAQCNINPIASTEPGKHVSGEQFQLEVQQALGKNFQKIAQAEQIDTRDGRWVYRVTAVGETTLGPTEWIYYLVAAPDGRQMVFVFIIEPKLVPALGNQDLSLVGGLEFLPAKSAPQPAARK